MYAIIRNNLVIGTTDELNYIKLQDNGCYGQDKSSNPKGIAFMSVAYNILGTNGIGCPESVEIREVDEETLKQLPKFDYLGEAMDKIVEWSKCWLTGGDVRACMDKQIDEFLSGVK